MISYNVPSFYLLLTSLPWVGNVVHYESLAVLKYELKLSAVTAFLQVNPDQLPLKQCTIFCSSSVCVVLSQAQDVISGPGAPVHFEGGWCSALGDTPAAHADREGARYSRKQSRTPGETPTSSPSALLTSYHFSSAPTTSSSLL